ncbi:uncharacterized protein LOC131073334 [Cryptomeria japonica]|uniref:uncharacterized protein LOC131073334 n=1 Tax=Cryptomeria japonica TaxID=3369 RepID=UPI0027DA5810|nr:uncharacterized protein LOC131073334 [Cryptomeria japonica]
MDHSLDSAQGPAVAGNPSKNSFSSSPSPPTTTTDVGLVSRRAKSGRKKSKVTRSQINDFHAAGNISTRNEEEEERSRINSEERSAGKSRNRYHVCKHCKRAFTSGRALGGHIRIHGASFKGGGRGAEEEFHNSLLMEGAAEVDGSDSSDADSSGSSEGGLSSPKMVSLYTLRNNPKRSSILMDPEFTHDLQGPAQRSSSSWQWQESVSGILPPLPYSSEYAGSQLRHRRTLLPNWSMTRSRSSRSSCSRAAAEPKRRGGPKDVGADHDDRDTAHLLVMLARRTRSNNNNEEERESTEESVYDSKPRVVSNLESQGSIEDLGGSGGEESRLVQKRRRKRNRTINKVEVEGGNLMFESDVDGDVGGIGESTQHQHQCNTCKKVFNSHQALGGHRASHRKVKGCFAADGNGEGIEEEVAGEGEGEGSFMLETEPEPEPERQLQGATAIMGSGFHAMNFEEEGAVTMSHLTQEETPEQESFSHKVGKAQTHQCSICHRIFSSGQALGGHKRCHWIGDRLTETATSVISTEKQQQQLESGCGRANWNLRDELLDLNQPPPMDEDDIRVAYGLDAISACAESVNQRVKMLGGSVTNNAVDSFKALK